MKFFIKTFGCQSNVYDSERIIDIMINSGYKQTEKYQEANVIIINTCHIREKSEQKLFSELGRYKIINGIEIVVTGCVAQAYKKKLFSYGATIVLGPQSYQELPRKLGTKSVLTSFTPQSKFDSLGERVTSLNAISSFIAIQEGCNKFCSYCVVPFTRGPEFSRDAEQIYHEAERLLKQGVKQITLLGQNVNAYRDKNGTTLANLIEQISSMGAERITYTSSHPSNVTEDLIEAHSIPELMPHLHFAVQSGSDRILKAMNRSHTAQDYIDIVRAMQKVRPEMTFSTDIIVGFPGETEGDFQDTLSLVHEVKFIQAYYFIYSPRKGTASYRMQDDLDHSVKKERLYRLKDVLAQYQYEYNKKFLNSETQVLVENKKHNRNEYFGRNQHMQPVHIISNESLSIGKIYNVEINRTFLRSLEGVVSQKNLAVI